MRLRLFHTSSGVRIAYREHGTGRPLVLAHSGGLSHREFEPLAQELEDRYRLVLCDLPGHGDSEVRPEHPYTFDWLAQTLALFCREVGGGTPVVGGHGLGGDLLVRAIALGELSPHKLILMGCGLHRPAGPVGREYERRGRMVSALSPLGGRRLGRQALIAAASLSPGSLGSTRPAAAAEPLRHATLDIATDRDRPRAWARVARAAAVAPRRDVLDILPRIACPTLLLWADRDPEHPLRGAREALDLLPDGMLRVVDGAGYLIAHDDPVATAREIKAFLG